MQVHQVGDIIKSAPEASGRDFPFSSLFAQLLGFSFGFVPAAACRSPDGICSSLRQDGTKAAADSEALAHSGRGEGGIWYVGQAHGGRGRHDVAPARGAPCILPGKLSLDHGNLAVAAAQAPGRVVWRVTCARTQASWRRQQQP